MKLLILLLLVLPMLLLRFCGFCCCGGAGDGDDRGDSWVVLCRRRWRAATNGRAEPGATVSASFLLEPAHTYRVFVYAARASQYVCFALHSHAQRDSRAFTQEQN